MTKRSLASLVAFWIASVAAVAVIAVGCSSSSPSTSCTSGTTVACTCPGGQSGTQACGAMTCSCGAIADSGASDAPASDDAPDNPGDATHRDDQAAPSTTYGVCALPGSFGWPCTADASGPDPAECTDPTFPDCFAGAQGGRCTAPCADGSVTACPVVTGDAGCVPTDCNARNYCK